MITKIQCKTEEEWRALRMKAIGGSDAGALLGLNQYKSPYALWAEKTGAIVPEDISDKEAVRLGNDLEQYVAERFTEQTGKKVRRCNFTLVNSDYPFAHANIDREVVGEKAGLECKTTSSWEVLQKCKSGEFPESWYCQVTHYMMVTGWDKFYLAVICFGHGFYVFEINRNEAEIKALAAAESEFWDKVIKHTPPELDGSQSTSEALRTIYADSSEARGSIDLTAVGTFLQIAVNLDKQIKELEEQRDSYKAQVMQFMGDAPKGSYQDITVSWKSQKRRTFDKAAYEKRFGKIPDEFYKETTVRPLKISIKGEK